MSTSAQEDQHIAKPQDTLAIGSFASLGREQLGDALLAFARQFPNVGLGVREMPRASLLPALRTGELALALMPEAEHAGLPSLRLWDDEVMVAVPRDHRLAATASVAPESLRDAVFLVPREQHGSDLHRFLAKRILPDDPSLNGVLVDLGPSRILEEVAAGKGIALLCRSHADLVGPDICLRPIEAAGAAFSVSAYWLAEPADDALALLLSLLRADG